MTDQQLQNLYEKAKDLADSEFKMLMEPKDILFLLKHLQKWKPIATVPPNKTVLLANFNAVELMCNVPHVWTSEYATVWVNFKGDTVDESAMWCDHPRAINKNGEPTHWSYPPGDPDDIEVYNEKNFAPFKKKD